MFLHRTKEYSPICAQRYRLSKALIGMKRMSFTGNLEQKASISALIFSYFDSSKSIKSILFMQKTICGIPNNDAIKACLHVCSTKPFLASTRINAKFAVDAPVTIFLGILNMSWSIGNNEFSLWCGKIPIGNIDCNSLLSFCSQAIG